MRLFVYLVVDRQIIDKNKCIGYLRFYIDQANVDPAFRKHEQNVFFFILWHCNVRLFDELGYVIFVL